MIGLRHLAVIVMAGLFAGPTVRIASQDSNKTAESRIAKVISGSELDRLKFYVGNWDYSEVYEKSVLFPSGGRNTGSWTGQLGPQGRSVISAFVSHGTGDNYEGIEVMTWDPKRKVTPHHSPCHTPPSQTSNLPQF